MEGFQFGIFCLSGYDIFQGRLCNAGKRIQFIDCDIYFLTQSCKS